MAHKISKRYSELNIHQKINAKIDILNSVKNMSYKHVKLMWAAKNNWLIITF